MTSALGRLQKLWSSIIDSVPASPTVRPARSLRRENQGSRVKIFDSSSLQLGAFQWVHFAEPMGMDSSIQAHSNAAVIQLSFASSHSDARTHWATPWDPHPKERPNQKRAPFDMMSVAPKFDLQLESGIADHTAKTIVSWGLGPVITDDRSSARAPGSGTETKGTSDDILEGYRCHVKCSTIW